MTTTFSSYAQKMYSSFPKKDIDWDISKSSTNMLRRFEFSIEDRYARLTASLPTNTSLLKSWLNEELRAKLPDYISTATTVSSSLGLNITKSSSYVLMGMPIHVVENDFLQLIVRNKLPSTGLSIHFHGFEMENAIQYDGVVGLTQCSIPPHDEFRYDFKIEETEGSYWYNTHSGTLGIEAHNMIKGPLIVHRDTPESRRIVDALNSIPNLGQIGPTVDYRSLLAYEKERILFFSDGFLKSDVMSEMYYVGGLNPPAQLNDDGFVAAATEYKFGTVNGKLREVVHVMRGQTYKLRLINGGSHFAYRLSIDGFSMSVVAADSGPVAPYEVDEVIIHNAERFDIIIKIPGDLKTGESFWIRADTLESRSHGYQNGIRAIMHVVDNMEEANTLHDNDIMDPKGDIIKGLTTAEERRTMNCYSNMEMDKAAKTGKGACLPITALTKPPLDLLHKPQEVHDQQDIDVTAVVVRTVDFDFNAPPLHAHFTRVGDGNWYQHTLRKNIHFLASEFNLDHDAHPNTAIMDVPSYSPVIIIWRSRSPMDHPMHLHGYKMEILETYAPKHETSCNLAKCKLPNIFDSSEKIESLKRIPLNTRPSKDTFIMPGGGAVATRIFTRAPAPWLAHCHTELHRQDGMGFIMNVGNYSAPFDKSWLPSDFPTCDSLFHQTQHDEPHCDCYIDDDAVLNTALDKTYKCSRPYLCMWQQSQVAQLRQNNTSAGYKLESPYLTPGWVISSSFVCAVAFITFAFAFICPRYFQRFRHSQPLTHDEENLSSPTTDDEPINDALLLFKTKRNEKPSFWFQFKTFLPIRWKEYRPTTVNILRVIEVLGLGLLTGFLFQDVGKNSTATGLGEKTSLLFFSSTLWCQTRMYPAISNYFNFKKDDMVILMEKNPQCDLLPIFLSRMVVVNACEALWPILFVFSAYPLALMFGDISKILTICVFLVLNNCCYIAIGALLGTLMPTVNLGMIGATLFGQMTVICAGFFTQLPPSVGWLRYISPIFYAFKGIVKTAFSWDDTYRCPKGMSSVGANNECFLEMSPAIDDYKQRGINVATFGDPSSTSVYVEGFTMLLLFSVCHASIYFFFRFVFLLRTKQEAPAAADTRHDKNLDSTTGINVFSEEGFFGDAKECTAKRTLNYASSTMIALNVLSRSDGTSGTSSDKSTTS